MTIRNTLYTYGKVTKTFHWLIFILLVGNIIYGYFLDDVPKAYQGIAFNIHKLIGLAILVLMALRFFWAISNPKPVLYLTSRFEKVAERTVHWLIYLLVIAMPLTGWVGSVAAGRPPHIGALMLNLPIPQSKIIAQNAFWLHVNIVILLIALLCFHVFAAFYHFFVKKDNVLQRMLPWGRNPESS